MRLIGSQRSVTVVPWRKMRQLYSGTHSPDAVNGPLLAVLLSRPTRTPSCGPDRWCYPSCILQPSSPPFGLQDRMAGH